jgi:hypothetical protein
MQGTCLAQRRALRCQGYRALANKKKLELRNTMGEKRDDWEGVSLLAYG